MNGRIGIIIGRPYYTINRPQLKGILRECFRSGRSACVFTQNEEFYDAHVFRQEWNVLHAVSFEELSGVIYLPYSIAKDETKSRITELLKSRCKCPVTVVTADRVPWPSVWFDEKSQFASVVTHLIESHGCRDILCLTGPPQMQTSGAVCRAGRRLSPPQVCLHRRNVSFTAISGRIPHGNLPVSSLTAPVPCPTL